MAEKGDTELEEAGQVFLLMKKDYRISRNVRLAWFLSHLHQPILPVPESELGLHDSELEVVSIVPHGWQPDDSFQPGPFLLVPSTSVTFLARQYRFVIELDLSPSTGIVDDSTGEIIFDEIFHSLSRCLVGLLRPFRIPGSNTLFRPEIFVTIQAYSSIIGLQSHQVLVQGCQLEEHKLQKFLQQVYHQLGAFENKVAEILQQQHRSLTQDCILPYGNQTSGRKIGVSMVTADIGLVSMIRQGILALQLLPANSSAGIIVITDGVTSVPDVAVCETLLNQLRSSTIACSFVQVGGVYSYDCSFGYVPNVELMKFIAMATLGSYLSSCPELEAAVLDMNVYHKAFLLYSFLRTGDALNPDYYCGSQHKLFNEHLVSASSNPALALRRRKHVEKEVHADLVSVVSVRLREGYNIREIRIAKGMLEVKLVLLWKHNMRVEYLAAASWPLDASKRNTLVEVVMEGSYDILHDISCTLKKPITSMYRTSVIRRFWNTLQSISQTDQMLVHLKSFDSVPEHFKIPESTKNGVPLFYIPPGSTTPVLSLQHNGSDSSHSQFAAYWKPILSMDANFWQRWLHVHRIVLLLEHDMPLPKHIHTPGNNGRYSTVLCRISHTALTSLLRDWSSFVLVEGYSYVKLMLSDVNHTPSSFCVVRIIWKAPCMVLRLGFPLGTPANSRNKIVEELRGRILQLRFPHRVQSKETTPRVKRKMFGISSPSKSPPPQLPSPAFSDRSCLVLLHKPLEKLLIKYDKLPLDYRTPFILNLESLAQHNSVPGPLTANRSASSTLASLSRYFYQQRWIWCVQSGLASSVPTPAMAQILSTLTEIRLSEGFHFASTGEGIINMVLEVPIQSDSVSEGSIEKHSCIIQYILFPPHVTSTKDSFSTDEDNDTEVEAIEQDTELHLVSECWVEPQSGRVMGNNECWKEHLQGLTYSEIPQALFPRDQSCISIMLTFEYIIQLCQNKDGGSPIMGKPESTDHAENSGLCIHEVPFHFDLMKLLPKCQQIEMLFLTLSRGETEETTSEASLSNDMLLSLFHSCLLNDINDREIPLYEQDHLAFMEQVLQRDRQGHPSPFSVPQEDLLSSSLTPESPQANSQYEISNSTSSLQSPCPSELNKGNRMSSSTEPSPKWRCYARLVNPQHLLLTFLPATFSDLQKLTTPHELSQLAEGNSLCNTSQQESAPSSITILPGSIPCVLVQDKEKRREPYNSFSRQSSTQDSSSSRRLPCPVYVYNCPLEALREQLVNNRNQQLCCDVFFRSQSQERPPAAPFIHLKQKEPVHYCSLLQEHYHQCYVKGLFKALQQSLGVSHQDLLTAVDYCEEQLQEIDITNFLMTLCGHLRNFRESLTVSRSSLSGQRQKASFRIGSLEQEDEMGTRNAANQHSESSVDMEEGSEQELKTMFAVEPSNSTSAEFHLPLLETGQPCEVSSGLHLAIQDKFLAVGSLHFKTVPSNPHYFFYCPSSPKKEQEDLLVENTERKPSEDMEVSEAEQAVEEGNTSTGGIATESDPDLEVEYREHSDNADSMSESETVNQDEDSFSVLGGESLNGQDLSENEMPPLFVHLICSVSHKNQHGSMPVLTLPTCLGEVIGCLENRDSLKTIALEDLNVMLDIYILTLPLEFDGVNEESQHTRYTSESSVSFPRSPGQPSSYRSDEEIPPALERFPSNVDQRYSALSRLPVEHRQAIEATMNEIRWLLEDELVSALRHSGVISKSVLQKVVSHICESEGRQHCYRELVQLQFVFGPEHSLQKFKEEFRHLSISGYQLNEEEEDYYYVSLSRLHTHLVENTTSRNATNQAETASDRKQWQDPEASTAVESMEEDTGPKIQYKECHAEDKISEPSTEWGKTALEVTESDVSSEISGVFNMEQGNRIQVEASPSERVPTPPKTSSSVSLPESVQSGNINSTASRQRPSRVQSLVSSHGSIESDHLGYDGGSSDSECEDALISEQDSRCPLMPDFWLIVKIHQDRIEVCTHASTDPAPKGGEEIKESLRLHQFVVRKVGEICRVVNQRLLLQDLHDTHLCNTLLVAESEEDIWKSESPYATYRRTLVNEADYTGEDSYQPRDYLAATMHFIPGHFACDVVWSTVIQIHPRLKMGPNMGVSRAIQSLRSVLSAFSVGNRKNMFVYQERTTKSVFYLRLTETSCNGRLWDTDLSQSMMSRPLGLYRSQEPISSEDIMGSRMSLDMQSSRSSDSPRPVGQTDKQILLLVHGVGEAGSEITDDLVKVLRKRLDETTLDIITLMLQRNCKLTPADVEFIQPRGTPPTEVLQFTIPQSSLPCLQAMAYYLRQNLLIFLHTPKYTDSNGEHHFQHYYHSSLPDLDLFLYNKPGGQGTGGKGIACIALSFVDQHGTLVTQAYGERTGPPIMCPAPYLLSPDKFESLTDVNRFNPESSTALSETLILVRFDVWEKGNISSLQLSERLGNSLRHALCDVIIEFYILQLPLCIDSISQEGPKAANNGKGPSQSMPEMKGLMQSSSKSRPSPINIPSSVSPGSPDPCTPPSKTGRRSFWDMLSKSDSGELGPPKTTDDIVSERTEEPRTRRRHKTESLKVPAFTDRHGIGVEHAQRKRQSQLEEGEIGSLHYLYSHTCLQWMNFMNQLGCPSVQLCSAQTVSRFLLPSVLLELFSIITSLASDTSVRVFEKLNGSEGPVFVPYSPTQHSPPHPASARELILLGRNFHQWRYNTEQVYTSDDDVGDDNDDEGIKMKKSQKGFQRFEAMELSTTDRPVELSPSGRGSVPRQRFLLIEIQDKKLTLYTYNWSPDLGASLSRSLVRLIQWQNARAHVVHCLLNQKLGLFHNYCFSDTPWHEDSKQDPNPFLNSTLEVDALIRSSTPPPYKEQTRLGTAGRSLPSLHFPPDMVPFDEVLRDVMPTKPMHPPSELDTVSRHGAQFLEIKSTERKEVEKQVKIENLFVTWQQRSAQSNMPISAADLDTLKQSARLVHYCATPLLFDPSFQAQIQNDQGWSEGKKRHRSNDSGTSGRDRSHSCDSAEMPASKAKEDPWLQELCTAFMQQYIQYLQSTGFILVQLRPASPARSTARIRALASLVPESRAAKPKNEGSPKSGSSTVTIYHLQRALPGGIVLMELSFQGCYFCVKQYALECSRIPMGQSVNSQGAISIRVHSKSSPESSSESALSMLFTEECDKVRDLMHVHSFSYDFHLRVVHQYLLGSSMSLRQGYDLASFLQLFISQHPDIPKYGRNHVYQGTLSLATGMIAAHQLYNYIADHASTYHMKPLRMIRPSTPANNGKKCVTGDQNEYGLVSIWNSSGSYIDSEGLRHHDDFDVSLLVCHNALPFEEQSEQERQTLRLQFYIIMTSQRELFPRLTADMRRFRKPPRLQRDAQELDGVQELAKCQRMEIENQEDTGEQNRMAAGNFYNPHLFPLLASEVATAQRQLVDMVQLAKCHCRRDNLWKRLYLLEPLASDKLKLGKLSSNELQELLEAVHGRSVAEIDPQLDFLLSMSVQWYQSLIKVLLSRFPQSCRHFHSPDTGTQYLVVLNQKFTDCFVLVFLDSHSSKTSLKVVFREPFPEQPQNSESPLPQLVSTYHHLESVINTACFNLWSGLL
ncbi:KICSTOR complex protein SZT2 isoform X4 [Xenopus tropicalis]|uniref:KICSTOR complex protein SZT2 isoform X4 n=1 Tax=Xenopus tropicalis TaxID=8364 RepID=A0A8J0T2H2_XENTR|nr:KICSTOR complex protein SZT2 isoform X4 [Xenopus tropicalis]